MAARSSLTLLCSAPHPPLIGCTLPWCREGRQAPAVTHKTCVDCGVQRRSAWYPRGSGSSGLQAKCRPCIALYDRQKAERNQRERELQDPVTAKMCSGCKKMLPVASFSGQASSKDGYCYSCRDCKYITDSARREEIQERSRNQTLVVAGGTVRICSQCHVKKPWADFHKRASCTSGIDSRCKQCRSNKRCAEIRSEAE